MGKRRCCAGGLWLPEMVEYAGGDQHLQEPGAPRAALAWDEVSLRSTHII